jgi:hypothetical protein
VLRITAFYFSNNLLREGAIAALITHWEKCVRLRKKFSKLVNGWENGVAAYLP